MLGIAGNYIRKGIFSAANVLTVLGLVALVIMTLLTVVDVCSRRFFNMPVTGTVEIVRFCLSIVVFATLAHCETNKTHIIVDVLVRMFRLQTQVVVRACTQVLSTIMLGVLSWQLFVYAAKLQDTGQVTSTLGVWVYPFVFIAAIGTVLFALVLLVQLADTIHEAKGK